MTKAYPWYTLNALIKLYLRYTLDVLIKVYLRYSGTSGILLEVHLRFYQCEIFAI